MILHAREKSHEYDDIKDQNDRPWNLKCTKLFDKLLRNKIYKKMDYHLVTNLRIKKVTAHLFIFPVWYAYYLGIQNTFALEV